MKDFKNLNVVDWLLIFWRRKWYFLPTLIVIAVGTTIYALRIPQVFRSETKIQIDTAVVSQDYVRPIVQSSPTERINAIREQIQSRSFLQQIIERFSLNGYGSTKEFVMEEAINGLSNNIKVVNGLGTTFTLSFAATEPSFARDVTRYIADKLIESNVSDRKSKTEKTDRFIEDQLRTTAKQLSDQEDKIRQFKIAHLGELPEQALTNATTINSYTTQLAGLDNAIQQAVDQRRQLDTRLAQVDILAKSLPKPAPQTAVIKQAPQDPVLTAMKEQMAVLRARGFTDAHPDVKKLAAQIQDYEMRAAAKVTEANAEESGLTSLASGSKPADSGGAQNGASSTMVELETSAIKTEIEKTDAIITRRRKERDDLVALIKAMDARLKRAPAMEQEMAALIREQETLRTQYANLQQKKFGTQMATTLESDTSSETYKIIDEANLPERPVFPNRVQIILMGTGAGFFFGLALSFIREYLDPTLGDENEVMAVLNLPVLAAVPEVFVSGDPMPKRLTS
jgi:polysaccharide chain length determinant protein (PEP-CTERM system associated)